MEFDFVTAQAQTFALFAKLADGLAFVHSTAQMAHMDLKGDNILIQVKQAEKRSSSVDVHGGVLLRLNPNAAASRMSDCKELSLSAEGDNPHQKMHVIPKIIDFGSAVPVSFWEDEHKAGYFWEDENYTSRSFFSFSPHQIRAPELLDRGHHERNRRGAGSDVWALAQLASYYVADRSIAGPSPVFWYHPEKAKFLRNPVGDELPEDLDTWCLVFHPNAPFSMTPCAWELFLDVFVYMDVWPHHPGLCGDPTTGESIVDAWPVRPIEYRMSARKFGDKMQACVTDPRGRRKMSVEGRPQGELHSDSMASTVDLGDQKTMPSELEALTVQMEKMQMSQAPETLPLDDDPSRTATDRDQIAQTSELSGSASMAPTVVLDQMKMSQETMPLGHPSPSRTATDQHQIAQTSEISGSASMAPTVVLDPDEQMFPPTMDLSPSGLGDQPSPPVNNYKDRPAGRGRSRSLVGPTVDQRGAVGRSKVRLSAPQSQPILDSDLRKLEGGWKDQKTETRYLISIKEPEEEAYDSEWQLELKDLDAPAITDEMRRTEKRGWINELKKRACQSLYVGKEAGEGLWIVFGPERGEDMSKLYHHSRRWHLVADHDGRWALEWVGEGGRRRIWYRDFGSSPPPHTQKPPPPPKAKQVEDEEKIEPNCDFPR